MKEGLWWLIAIIAWFSIMGYSVSTGASLSKAFGKRRIAGMK